ncbi:MAG: hypothetical protein ACOCWM_04070 [Cyclobacteriaceae bacterium]
MNEIFNKIAAAILDVLPRNRAFKYTTLKIKRLKGNVGFTGYFVSDNGIRESLDIWNFALETDEIHKLYELTQSQPLQHKDWNRAKFTLYPDGKFDMEYIWDQELQDKVDKYNSSSE